MPFADPRARLEHILEAIREIGGFTAGRTLEPAWHARNYDASLAGRLTLADLRFLAVPIGTTFEALRAAFMSVRRVEVAHVKCGSSA
jgi:hypothetical protein